MTHAVTAQLPHDTSMGLDSRKMAFWAFIGSECLLFTSLISTYPVHKVLTLQTNLFGCTFFVLAGTHGAHVSVGVLWLRTLWVRALQGKLGPANAMTVEITGLYWHFVDVVWIVIFTVVYLIQ